MTLTFNIDLKMSSQLDNHACRREKPVIFYPRLRRQKSVGLLSWEFEHSNIFQVLNQDSASRARNIDIPATNCVV